MERDRLIQLAPHYYTIAICNYFEHRAPTASVNTLWGTLDIKNNALFYPVLNSLVAKGMLTPIKDDFGPTLYSRTDGFSAKWDSMKKTADSPYSRFMLDPERFDWLTAALAAVNKALNEQKIKIEDFEKPDAEWEPLPVERSNPKLKRATEKLDEAIAAVEADNGYNATLPDEKAYVVENLKNASDRLKRDDTISYAYLKRKVIDVLDVVIRRFTTATVGLAAQAAKAALLDWLKELGEKVLHWIV